ncbi:MAG: cobyric acid synthase CobQ, partial [Frankiales bacterium]|nr:cobyric acid synthase CobQ [Frankiales bacterium]
FGRDKVLARPVGEAFGHPVQGYEIHHGVVEVLGGEPFLDGCTQGSVTGTTWHGIFENDGFRRAFLADLAVRAGRRFVASPDTSFAGLRQQRLDALGDAVASQLDTDALLRLIEDGPPRDLPTVTIGLSHPGAVG